MILALSNLALFVGLTVLLGAVTLRYLVLTRSGLALSERAPAARDAAKHGMVGAALILAGAPLRAYAQASALAFPGDAIGALLRTVVMESALGRALQLQAIWAAAALLACASARFGRQRGWSAAAISALVLTVVPGLSGHAAAEGTVTALAAAIAHVLGVGLWIGGLLQLWRISKPASEATLTRLIQAFHGVALVGAGLVVASGLVHVASQWTAPAALLRSAWGALLAAKLMAFAAVAALGFRHWRGAERQVAGGGRAALRASLRREVLLAAGVLVITAFLTSVAPPE